MAGFSLFSSNKDTAQPSWGESPNPERSTQRARRNARNAAKTYGKGDAWIDAGHRRERELEAGRTPRTGRFGALFGR